MAEVTGQQSKHVSRAVRYEVGDAGHPRPGILRRHRRLPGLVQQKPAGRGVWEPGCDGHRARDPVHPGGLLSRPLGVLEAFLCLLYT